MNLFIDFPINIRLNTNMIKKIYILIFSIALTLSACNLAEQPQSKGAKLTYVELNDGDEYSLSAEHINNKLYGHQLNMMGYNSLLPGPMIKVKQGSEITLKFTNNTDIENTIHSHGVRLENAFDGVPNVTQKAVQPGETFDYKIKFPDPGVYWYHPHVREDMTQEMGLYGAFIVSPEDSNYWNPVNREEIVFLDDILLSKDGLDSFDSKSVDHALMGRFGNEFLINGSEKYQLDAQTGEVIRFVFINAANVRPFNISIEGAKMKLVGSDGGKYDNEKFVDSIVISPSERYLVEVYFDKPGKYKLKHISPDNSYNLGAINVTSSDLAVEDFSSTFTKLQTGQSIENSIPDFASYLEKAPDKELRLSIDTGGMMMSGMPCHEMPDGSKMGNCETSGTPVTGGIEWEDDMGMMNKFSTNETVTWQISDEKTDDINDKIDWKFKKDEYVKVRIFNDPDSMHPMQHPIHFHGQRFLVLKQNGLKNNNLVWKDTVLVPEGDTIDILIEMSNVGTWMAHCHIAEHLHSDMMFGFEVRSTQ